MDFLETFLVIFLSSVAARSVGILLFKGADREKRKNADSECVIVKNSPIFIVVGILVLAFGIGMMILDKLGILIGSSIGKVFLIVFPILFVKFHLFPKGT